MVQQYTPLTRNDLVLKDPEIAAEKRTSKTPVVIFAPVVVFVEVGLLRDDRRVDHVRREIKSGAEEVVRTNAEALQNQSADSLGEEAAAASTATAAIIKIPASVTVDGELRGSIAQEPLLHVSAVPTHLATAVGEKCGLASKLHKRR